MKRYCHRCGEVIHNETTLARGSVYCGSDCKRLANNERREQRARVKCRLCGRRYRKSKGNKGNGETIESGPSAAGAQANVEQPSIPDHWSRLGEAAIHLEEGKTELEIANELVRSPLFRTSYPARQ